MKILILNQAFWPDVVATAQHMSDWAEYLTAQGHQVSVIASRSVYGQASASLPKRETHNNIRIYRVGFSLFKKGSILTRIIDFGTFHLLALWRALWLPKHDVVVCLTTPPFIGVIGAAMKILKGSRYIQYEMDLYPDVPVALGVMKKNSLATRFFEGVHRWLLKKADRIVVLGRCMKKVIASKGIPEDKMLLVTPWADPEELKSIPHEQNAFRHEHGLDGKFVVMYSGNLGLGHDITTLCGAMLALKDDPHIRFVFIGGGKRMKEIEKFTRENNIPAPLMLGYQPREKLSETLSAADVHIITQAAGTTGLIVPSKLWGILAVNRPAIYIGPDDTEVAMQIKEQNCGKVLAIGDIQPLIQILAHLCNEQKNTSAYVPANSRHSCVAALMHAFS